MAAAHGGAPAKELVGGEAGDLQEVEGEPFRGLVRAGEGRRWWRSVQSKRRPWQAAALRRRRHTGPAGSEAGSASRQAASTRRRHEPRRALERGGDGTARLEP